MEFFAGLFGIIKGFINVLFIFILESLAFGGPFWFFYAFIYHKLQLPYLEYWDCFSLLLLIKFARYSVFSSLNQGMGQSKVIMIPPRNSDNSEI